MVFRSKVDTFFVSFISIAVLIIGLACFFPLFLEGGSELPVAVILILIFLMVTGFILWCAFSVKYVFYQEYLFIKGGPFKSRISYEKITKVSPTKDIFTGYRVLSSRDGIEIFYTKAVLGSVKISPKEKKEFITELTKRCPRVQVQE
ncbi:PH domain-containing protein [Gracilibacillus salinarum]|uniref:PH domain-containing protein n=1 Tax=Gracilibacillus salinarum TaxID=2932255 RepID=A0ABY4GQS0_9BACI|nr:PH domain-containing protein [Gracilibacillus salinarum]UOQ86579.1 PH domain-containing protein [Gracilibacillus salinarum]